MYKSHFLFKSLMPVLSEVLLHVLTQVDRKGSPQCKTEPLLLWPIVTTQGQAFWKMFKISEFGFLH